MLVFIGPMIECRQVLTMSFRVLYPISLALILTVGCARENEPYTHEVEILAGEQCFDDLAPSLSQFIQGDLSAEGLVSFWGCLSQAIKSFEELTQGQNSEFYTVQELQKFIEDFFLDSGTIRLSLIQEVMEIKRLLVGGAVHQISRSELNGLLEIMDELKKSTLKINPYMKLYFSAWTGQKNTSLTPADIMPATEALESVLQRLGSLLDARGESYSFVNLENLLREVSYINKGSLRVLDSELLKLLMTVKQTLIGPPVDSIMGGQWKKLLSVAGQLLNSYFHMNYFVVDQDWKDPQVLGVLSSVVTQILDSLQDLSGQRENGYIPFSDLEILVDGIDRAGWLPLGLSGEDIKKVLPPLVNKILATTPSGELIEESQGLKPQHVENLKFEVGHWALIQGTISQLTAGGETLSADHPVWQSHPALKEMGEIVSGPWPLNLDSIGRLRFDFVNSDKEAYDRSSLTTLNWQRAVIRVLFRSYSQQDHRRARPVAVNKTELAMMARDLGPVAVALGLFSASDANAYESLFEESNLFLPRSNGDDQLDFAEAVEYFAYIFSGLRAAQVGYAHLMPLCGGGPSLEKTCVRDQLFLYRETILSHKPDLLFYLELAEGQRTWLKYWDLLESTLNLRERNEVALGDLTKILVLAQFVEGFFGRFDADLSSTINVDESLQAFEQVFKQPLSRIFEGFEEEQTRALYTFLMKYGTSPFDPDMTGGAVRFRHWFWHPERWDYEADRLGLIRILSTLVSH